MSTLNEGQKAALENLMAQLELPEHEVNLLFQKAIDGRYWRTLFPGLGVTAQQSFNHLEDVALSSAEETSALTHLEKHGYFQMPAFIAPSVVIQMCDSIETLRSMGWPAIFSFVYDEFWATLRTSSIVRFLSRKLGAGYSQTAAIWTYYVDPGTRSSGWGPHVDSRNDEERLTVWIPLTDATVANGCIYVIPQDRVPSRLPASYFDWTSVSRQDLEFLLHSTTPLPAALGSVLGWNNSVIHWGGRTSDVRARPRISIAGEFLPEGATPRSWEQPVFDRHIPEFPLRMRVIGQAILDYEKFEPMLRKYRNLATKLIAWAN